MLSIETMCQELQVIDAKVDDAMTRASAISEMVNEEQCIASREFIEYVGIEDVLRSFNTVITTLGGLDGKMAMTHYDIANLIMWLKK